MCLCVNILYMYMLYEMNVCTYVPTTTTTTTTTNTTTINYKLWSKRDLEFGKL